MFNRLPFGMSSAPEHFQRCMFEILEGLPGFVCIMDAILVFGKSKSEHDQRLHAVPRQLGQAGITLKGNGLFSNPSVTVRGP